jgi:hypothetical protein
MMQNFIYNKAAIFAHVFGKLTIPEIILTAALSGLCSFFAPIWAFLLGVGILVWSDFYTGTRAAKKRGEEIRSKKMRTSISKAKEYMWAIILTEIFRLIFFVWSVPIEAHRVTTYIPVTYIIAFAIAAVELKSNLENIKDSTGLDLWSILKEKIKI